MTTIKKLPPGRALGADDLRWWSMRRNAGRSRAGTSKEEAKKLAEWRRPKKLDAADRWLADHDKGKR
jgi:hypothetical protein